VDLLPTSHPKKVAALQDFCERRLLRRRAHCDLLSPLKHNSLRERSVFACFRGRYSLRERSVFCLSSCKRRPAFLPYVQGTLSERSVFPCALRIENAYVTNSLCCPSRATILRGQYPHNHSILGNSLLEGGGEKKFRQLGRDRSTIATWLDNAGYWTKLIGKYMNSSGGWPRRGRSWRACSQKKQRGGSYAR
jgi:hypothetical protein